MSAIDLSINVKDNSDASFSKLKSNIKDIKSGYREITSDARNFNQLLVASSFIGNLRDSFSGDGSATQAGKTVETIRGISGTLGGFIGGELVGLLMRKFFGPMVKLAVGGVIRAGTKLVATAIGTIVPLIGNIAGFVAGDFLGRKIADEILSILPGSLGNYIRKEEFDQAMDQIQNKDDPKNPGKRIVRNINDLVATQNFGSELDSENANNEINRRVQPFYDYIYRTNDIENAMYRLTRQ